MTQPTDDTPREGLPPLDLTDAVQATWLAMLALRAAAEAGQRPAALDPFLADMETIIGCLRAALAAIADSVPGAAGDDLIAARARCEDVIRNLGKARESYARHLATRERLDGLQ